ncbi:MAG TPA: phosphoribosyltransferase family protein [Rhizomicrobium sp.]|nr:phosphoribosyltransferase family protein [Rhizomicrobium sp.]
MSVPHQVLVSETEIFQRMAQLADEIVAARTRPDMAAVVLVGGFVFAADLLRALARRGLDLPAEFFWLRSYAGAREGARDVSVMISPTARVRGHNVLLLDGILDRGRTLAKAIDLLREQGALSVTSAVMVERGRPDAGLRADYAAFTGLDGFLIGYGMDDAGRHRGLPYIARAD